MVFSSSKARGIVIISGLMIFGLIVSLSVGLTNSDLSVVSSFYMPCDKNNVWPAGKAEPFHFLYKYGEIPGIVLAVLALFALVLVRIGKIQKLYSRPLLVVILTVVLGPGLVVNGILKEHWGRNRPADLQMFGGSEQYRHFWNPGGTGTGKSFVCGHCAIAFSTCSVIAFYPIHPLGASVGLAIGLVYGGLVSLARIAQGGHFPTDVIWSAVIILTIITCLYYFILKIPDQKQNYTKNENRLD